MTMRRDVEPADTRRTVEVVDQSEPVVVDRPVVVQDHQEAIAHEGERVTRRASGYDLARGWMRTFNMTVAFILLLIETALVFRLALKLGGANADNGFVNFIYNVSNPFISPFKGIANHTTSTSGNSIFEPETLIAMGVWAAVAILLIVLVSVITSAPASAETESVTRERYAHLDKRS